MEEHEISCPSLIQREAERIFEGAIEEWANELDWSVDEPNDEEEE